MFQTVSDTTLSALGRDFQTFELVWDLEFRIWNLGFLLRLEDLFDDFMVHHLDLLIGSLQKT